MRPPLRPAVPALFLLFQGCAAVSLGANRYLASGAPDLTALALAREASLGGPIGYETHAVVRSAGDAEAGWMAGAGIDLTVLAGHPGNPYLIGGVQAGVGTRDHPSTWSSWSVGLGTQFLRAGPLGLRVEARYRRLSAGPRRGLEVGVRIGRGWTEAGSRPPAPLVPPGGIEPGRNAGLPVITAESAGGGESGAMRAAITTLAGQAMGTPYRWGGSDANGFDCSGLIQYAYGQHGIALPRTSAGQSLAGEPVDRDPSALLPGDILTFATQGGGRVTHVGLYLGSGRFLHSATGGVQVSVLSSSDPYGRWWWNRWVGARRVVGGAR